jgi:hypothetical protein
MAEQSLEEKTKKAWLWRIEKNPEFAERYGRDGWAVWLKYHLELTLEEMAALFDVTVTTAYRWNKQHRLTKGGVH